MSELGEALETQHFQGSIVDKVLAIAENTSDLLEATESEIEEHVLAGAKMLVAKRFRNWLADLRKQSSLEEWVPPEETALADDLVHFMRKKRLNEARGGWLGRTFLNEYPQHRHASKAGTFKRRLSKPDRRFHVVDVTTPPDFKVVLNDKRKHTDAAQEQPSRRRRTN